MGIELREPALVRQIEQLASELTQPAEQVLQMAVRAYVDRVERRIIQAETSAFWTMYDDLVSDYEGHYVAVHGGAVVDHDVDVSELERRVRATFGPKPILIAPVVVGQQRDVFWLGGRTESNR